MSQAATLLEPKEIPFERAPGSGKARRRRSAGEGSWAGNDLGFEEGMTLATVAGNDLLALVKAADECAAARWATHHLRGEPEFEFHQCVHRGLRVLRVQPGPDASDAYFHSTEKVN